MLYLCFIKNWPNSLKNYNFRHLIWPISSFEFPKFLPMAILIFIILLNYNLVRAIKDSLIITLVGPESISFIKLWCEMPLGVLLVIVYSKLCNIFTTEQVFRIIVIIFSSFLIIFAFILYPYQSYFHPSPLTIDYYTIQLPHFKWFIIIWGKWSFVLLYTIGELWPTIIFSLLFWQLANKITNTEEATRFYPAFSLFGQSNLLVSGIIICYFTGEKHFLLSIYGNLTDTTEIILKSMTTIITSVNLLILCLHYFIEKTVVYSNRNIKPENKKDYILKLSLKDSLKIILKAKYLGFIFLLIICYNITVNLIEGLWMSKVKLLYPSVKSFMHYHGNVLFWTGVFALLCALIGSTLIRSYGWFIAAVITPVMTMLNGIVFFTFVIIEVKLEITSLSFITPLIIIVFIGGLQNVLSKGTKYSLFDTTKEMLYIPLNNELKTKGKAVVDVIGTKIGKSAGSFIQFMLLTILLNAKYSDIVNYLMIVFVITCLTWILVVKKLAQEYDNLLK